MPVITELADLIPKTNYKQRSSHKQNPAIVGFLLASPTRLPYSPLLVSINEDLTKVGGQMAKRLVITFSEEATAAYLAATTARLEAEVNNDCEPTGVSLMIEIAPSVYDSTALINERALGTVEVNFIES